MKSRKKEIEVPTKTVHKYWIFIRRKKRKKKISSSVYLDEEDFKRKITIEKKNLTDRIGQIVGKEKDKIQRIDAYGERITVSLNERVIDKIAEELDCKVGKWMLFIPEKEIDAIWRKISKAVFSGKLGSCESAKVATAKQAKKKYLICIYTPDYFDVRDVMKVREKLREIGFDKTLYYKPDIYTHLGIYSKNPHVKASKYKS